MKLYDISMTINEGIPVWKNLEKKRPKFENISNFATAKTFGSCLHLDAHTGTHVDAPLHMIAGGAAMEAYSLEQFVGPARVLDLTRAEDSVGRTDLEPHGIKRGEWILLKTKNSFSAQFDFDFVYVRADGAAYLKEIGVRGVGIDSLGIERGQADYATHRTLLGSGIVIAEGLRLGDVPAGSYFMVIAPLKLEGVEAAPARAFLIDGS